MILIIQTFNFKTRTFTQQQLSLFNGLNESRPVLLSILGQVFDVSSSSAYKPNGSYSFFAGKDASRAYATGCFKTHLTHDLRGLTAGQLASIDGWLKFYQKRYPKVGIVVLDKVSGPFLDKC